MVSYATMPPDIKRIFYEYADLPVRTIESLCSKNREIYTTLCQNKAFWVNLADRRLNRYIDYREPHNTISEIRKRLIMFDDLFVDTEDFLTKLSNASNRSRITPSRIQPFINNLTTAIFNGYDNIVEESLPILSGIKNQNVRQNALYVLLLDAVTDKNLYLAKKIYPLVKDDIVEGRMAEAKYHKLIMTAIRFGYDDMISYFLINKPYAKDYSDIILLVEIGVKKNDWNMVNEYLPYITSISESDIEHLDNRLSEAKGTNPELYDYTMNYLYEHRENL